MKANYDKQQLFVEQVRQLHKHTPIVITATLLTASALTFVMWNVISPYILVTWFSAIVIVTLVRYAFLFKHHHSLANLVETRRWRNWFVFGIALSGILWGSTGVLLFPVDSSLHQFFLACVIVGMLGGATGTLSVEMSAFLAFSLPLIIPIAIRFVIIGDIVHITIGCLALIFWLLMFFTARHINASAVKILTLNNSLAEAKERTESINEALKSEIEQRKKAEQELLVHQEQLEDLIKERTTELSITNQKLQQQIDERKKMVAALQESEEQFRELAELLPVAIYEMDVAGKVTFANQGAFEYFGYTQEDLIQGLNGFDMIVPENRSKAIQNIQRVLDGEKLGLKEYVALRKDGSTFPALANSTTIVRGGKPVGIRGLIMDITERKQAEDALRASEERLARLKRMESLGLMAGGIAHDLNNILSGIVSYPDLLLMDLSVDSSLRQPIEIIKESGNRAADVVSDLLTVARGVATGKEVSSLNSIVNDYMHSAEHRQLEGMNPFIGFNTEIDAGLLNITCSPTHIKKILMNLVVNATEAIENSGAITISTTNQYLDEPLRGYEDVRTGEYVLLAVSDNGVGISNEDLERIFEPFYTKKVMGRSGTGLGLAVVWNTLQDHDGYVNVKSGENGSVFELYFPVTRDAIADAKKEVPPEEYFGQGERILVVDDEENQRVIACALLAKLGYTAEAVTSGEAAVEYLKDNSVDLILLDMIMPKGMNGRETYEKVIKIHPNQKAIIASGFAKTDDVKEAQKLGAGEYVEKPYTLEKIGMAIKAELE